MRLAGKDGLALAASAYGDPADPPAVLLHGGGQTRHAWGGTAAALARRGWYALALDLRGHGDSAWAPGGDYSMDALVDDLRAVLAGLRRPPILVGASLGGLVGLLVEGESAERRLAALVLVDVAHRAEREGVDRILDFMKRDLGGFPSLEAAAEAIAAYLPHRPRRKDLDGLRKNLRRGEDGRYRWHWDPEFVLSLRTPNATRTPERMTEAARRLRVPTLLVRGRMSDVVSHEVAAEFLRLVPHARYVDVSGAGHMVAGDENDAFTGAVLEFADGIRAARADL